MMLPSLPLPVALARWVVRNVRSLKCVASLVRPMASPCQARSLPASLHPSLQAPNLQAPNLQARESNQGMSPRRWKGLPDTRERRRIHGRFHRKVAANMEGPIGHKETSLCIGKGSKPFLTRTCLHIGVAAGCCWFLLLLEEEEEVSAVTGKERV